MKSGPLYSQLDSDSDLRKKGWIQIQLDSDSRCPDSDSRCPDSHITDTNQCLSCKLFFKQTYKNRIHLISVQIISTSSRFPFRGGRVFSKLVMNFFLLATLNFMDGPLGSGLAEQIYRFSLPGWDCHP